MSFLPPNFLLSFPPIPTSISAQVALSLQTGDQSLVAVINLWWEKDIGFVLSFFFFSVLVHISVGSLALVVGI